MTERELNRALLARQLLLERSSLSIPRALERLGGIQNQYAPNAYIRLASCLETFQRDQLTRALGRRTVVQGTLMRTTIHTVSAPDFGLFSAGLRRARREWYLRVNKGTDAGELQRLARRLRAALADGPLTKAELDRALPGWGRAALWLDLVRAPPSGTWERRRADLYGLAPEAEASERDGLEHLVRRYLGGFGPARVREIASWAGVPPAWFEPVVESLALRELGDGLLDLPRAPLPGADTPAPVRFLPTWDATLLVHARRAGVISEEYRKIVFHVKVPPSTPTFLVDGRVAGAWRYDGDRVVLEPFEKISRTTRRELADEAERMRVLL